MLIPPPISFISSNCAGGVISHDLGLPFCSPTVNLFFNAEDYIRFAENLDHYLSCKLIECENQKSYPLGHLDDIEIHFLHYKTFTEAKEKWEKRLKRINKDNMVFIMTDQNGCTKEHLNRFLKLNGKKSFLTTNKDFKIDDSVIYMDSEEYKKKHNGRTLVDDAFIFRGFSGKRNYEYFLDLKRFL